uniref:NADH-ubiquinone oxidoreductase chain 4L n=1 Tax=Procecidochares utilis TaxID=716600 RepID=M1QY68_9MUSC|nr:NADH dehydrogenase subunit 4L [Procecidochares utilis]AGG10668.1 NADH dehydrogenase subunit 4L [Procecidochares utilis]UXG57164.1 NADH dehydrogenase subunit 4L [Procecidochares utilis]
MLMILYWILPFILFLMGIFVFVSNRKHLLSMLLCLEFIMLNLFLFLFMYLSLMDYSMYFSMIFLIFCVCEGALGLSILVSLIRTHGNDYFQSLNLL